MTEKARELLAAECAKNGISAEYIDKVLSGNVGDGGQEGYEITIAAINAALRTAPATDPIIPADKWPEWADRLVWNEAGTAFFFGWTPQAGQWAMVRGKASITLPPGHDWRVPVMRPTAEESSVVRSATAARTAPKGYRLVPEEPTPLMVATFRADKEHGAMTWSTHTRVQCADFASRYTAMLAAAQERE